MQNQITFIKKNNVHKCVILLLSPLVFQWYIQLASTNRHKSNIKYRFDVCNTTLQHVLFLAFSPQQNIVQSQISHT